MEHKNQDHMLECQVSESHTPESHTLESHTPETHTAAADTADMVATADTANVADRSGTATTADKSVTGSKRPKDKIQLSDHFDYKRLFRFVLPSVAMMISETSFRKSCVFTLWYCLDVCLITTSSHFFGTIGR